MLLLARSYGGIRVRAKSLLSFFFEKRDISRAPSRSFASYSETPGSPCYQSARPFSPTRPDPVLDLPRFCPGCGAFTQSTIPDQPGYYGVNRKAVQAFLAWSRNIHTELDDKSSGPARGLTEGCFSEQSIRDQGLNFLSGLTVMPLAGIACC